MTVQYCKLGSPQLAKFDHCISQFGLYLFFLIIVSLKIISKFRKSLLSVLTLSYYLFKETIHSKTDPLKRSILSYMLYWSVQMSWWKKWKKNWNRHYVKRVCIRSYSGPHFSTHFPAFGLNMERYQNNSEYGLFEYERSEKMFIYIHESHQYLSWKIFVESQSTLIILEISVYTN